MEGMPGTYNWEQETTDRAAVKHCMQSHLMVVLETIKDSQQNHLIDEIVVADSHAGGDNISYDITGFDERIDLISGGPRPFYMMPAFSSNYNRVFLLGYHAGTGALKGNMDHTYSNRRIHKIWLNGIRMNEAMINAAYAGYCGVPVTLISGDKALYDEIITAETMPWVSFVTTKEAVGKFAAKNYSVHRVRAQTVEAVHKALIKPKEEYPLYTFTAPITLRIEFISTSMADVACLMPDVKRLDGKTVEYVNGDYAVMFEAIMALVTLAYSANLS